MLNLALSSVIDALKEWILRYVPIATGQLQENLIEWLYQSRVNYGTQLYITIGTDVEYAKYANAMPASSLQHHGEVAYRRRYGKVTLDDPTAQHNFMGLLRMEAKRALKVAISDAIRQQLAGSKGYGAIKSEIAIGGKALPPGSPP